MKKLALYAVAAIIAYAVGRAAWKKGLPLIAKVPVIGPILVDAIA